MVFCLVVNIGTVDKAWKPTGVMHKLGMALWLQQTWHMFAPNVSSDSGWFVFPGETHSGIKVDVFAETLGPVDGLSPCARGETDRKLCIDWRLPEAPSANIRTQRWRKILRPMLGKDKVTKPAKYMDTTLAYLCRRYNQLVPAGKRTLHLKSFDLSFVVERTLAVGRHDSPKRRTVASHVCEYSETYLERVAEDLRRIELGVAAQASVSDDNEVDEVGEDDDDAKTDL